MVTDFRTIEAWLYFLSVCFRHESEALLVDADLDIGEHVYTIETTDDVQALKFGIIMVTDSFYFRLNTYNNRK